MTDMTTKDWIQYSTAIAMIASGILLAFLSFYHNDGDIAEGVLWYMAQALTYAGGVFGVSIYFKTKLGDFESRAKAEIARALEEAEQRGERKHNESEEIKPLDNDII
jgi:hypothetical protein